MQYNATRMADGRFRCSIAFFYFFFVFNFYEQHWIKILSTHWYHRMQNALGVTVTSSILHEHIQYVKQAPDISRNALSADYWQILTSQPCKMVWYEMCKASTQLTNKPIESVHTNIIIFYFLKIYSLLSCAIECLLFARVVEICKESNLFSTNNNNCGFHIHTHNTQTIDKLELSIDKWIPHTTCNKDRGEHRNDSS